MRFARLPFFPFLLWIYPTLYYFVQNRYELEWLEIIRPLLGSLLIAAVAVGLSYLVIGNREGAMLLSLVLLFLVFAFPIVNSLILLWISDELGYFQVMVPWCALGAAVYALSAFKFAGWKDTGRVTPYLNLFAATLCGVQVFVIAVSVLRRPTFDDAVGDRHAQWADDLLLQLKTSDLDAKDRTLPDIYFLILDAYARADVLQSRFDYNNDAFLAELRRAGFFVADRSHANYAWTHLSLSATLNCQYLQDLLPDAFAAGAPRSYRHRNMYYLKKCRREYIQTNRVRQFLEKQGYQWHTTRTGYVTPRTEDSIWDVLLGSMTRFEAVLLQRSVFKPLAWRTSMHDKWRKQLDSFVELSNRKGPKFVFSHVISPHRPFCFDEKGDEVKVHPVYDFSNWPEDCHPMPGYDDYFRENYPKNVAGLNIYALRCVKSLLAKTKGEAIIIVQADHGPDLGLYPRQPTRTDMLERFGILNAIYLPPRYSRDRLDDSISSIQTFRIVLNEVFGLDLDRLDDRAWFSDGGMDCIDVTDAVRNEGE